MSSTTAPRPASLLAPEYRLTTIGAFAMIFLAAFEALAVTTIMKTVADDLDGQALYSASFSATLAAGVIGMVVGGQWSDRSGPVPPLITAILVFVVGLLAAGTAVDMTVFLAGRFLQGLGAGALNVALYVVVARVFPPDLHARIFGVFAAAWVLPSMIGPPAAGLVADRISWHWVFLGVAVLVVIATVLLIPTLRLLRGREPDAAAVHDAATDPRAARRSRPLAVALSVVVAVAVLGISLAPEAGVTWGWAIAAAGLAVVALCLRPLLPTGTLVVRRGLPATVLLRGAVAAGFFGTEIYLPYLFQERYAMPPWLAGLILTVGAVSWAIGSAIQGRVEDRLPHSAAVRLGAGLVAVGIVIQFSVALFELSPIVSALGWFVAGAGMGVVFPRVSTLVLAYSTARDQGFNSAAMSISDSVGGATSIALAGLVFATVGGLDAPWSFAAAIGLTALLAVLAVPVAIRVRERPSITAR